MDLTDEVAVVTGASRGVGRAIAQRCASAGARTVLVSRDEDQLRSVLTEIEDEGGEAFAVATDVTDPGSVESLADGVLSRWGPPDLLVNVAGSLVPIGPLWEADVDDWWRDVEVNLRGTFLPCRAFLPAMIDAGRGRVINFGGGGTVRPMPYVTAYGSAKAAIARLTETLDIELQGTGVLAFTMSPGFVHTDMTDRFRSTADGRRYLKTLADRLDRGEHTPAEDAAEIVLQIASGALDQLHGRYLHAGVDLHQIDALRARAREIAAGTERTLVMDGFSL